MAKTLVVIVAAMWMCAGLGCVSDSPDSDDAPYVYADAGLDCGSDAADPVDTEPHKLCDGDNASNCPERHCMIGYCDNGHCAYASAGPWVICFRPDHSASTCADPSCSRYAD